MFPSTEALPLAGAARGRLRLVDHASGRSLLKFSAAPPIIKGRHVATQWNVCVRAGGDYTRAYNPTMAETLPLFPYEDVLFPGMLLPLHISEPRYRLMINRCVTNKAPFGVVLATEGEEPASKADFFSVGTTARITRVQRTDQGRLIVASVGEQRFRVLRMIEDEPYTQGQVELIPEQPGDRTVLDTLTSKALLLLTRYLHLVTGSPELGQNLREKDLSPQKLSYTVGTLLQVEREEKQAILEIATTTARLEHEIDLLTSEVRQLRLLGQSQRQEAAPPALLWSPN